MEKIGSRSETRGKMESGPYSGWKRSSSQWLEEAEENGEAKRLSSLPPIPQPQTPNEPMEFLARSWRISAQDISAALAKKQKQLALESCPNATPDCAATPEMENRAVDSRRSGPIGKWFHNRNLSTKKKEKVRLDNAHLHASLSIAGLAAAIAAVSAEDGKSDRGSCSKLKLALASATELVASHCIELAESAGAHRHQIASVVSSAMDIRTPGDLMTLTAGAATALRGEAILRARLPRESRKNAAISPYQGGGAESQPIANPHDDPEENNSRWRGKLWLHTRKGLLRKCLTIFINKKSQVIMKLDNKHIGGAFTKKNKCVVYGVCSEFSDWPFEEEREDMEEVCFGLKTGQGFLEFKCESSLQKKRWVDGIQNLLHQVSHVEATVQSLENLKC